MTARWIFLLWYISLRVLCQNCSLYTDFASCVNANCVFCTDSNECSMGPCPLGREEFTQQGCNCQQYNSCSSCLDVPDCYFCYGNNKCGSTNNCPNLDVALNCFNHFVSSAFEGDSSFNLDAIIGVVLLVSSVYCVTCCLLFRRRMLQLPTITKSSSNRSIVGNASLNSYELSQIHIKSNVWTKEKMFSESSDDSDSDSSWSEEAPSVIPWTTTNHHLMDNLVKTQIKTVLTLALEDTEVGRHPESGFDRIPKEILYMIFEYLAADDTNREIPLVYQFANKSRRVEKVICPNCDDLVSVSHTGRCRRCYTRIKKHIQNQKVT